MTTSPEEDFDNPNVMENGPIIVNNSFDEPPPTSSLALSVEILVYCQNFNRMRSACKMSEIHKNILSSSFHIILGTETSWNESVKSEEIIMVAIIMFSEMTAIYY